MENGNFLSLLSAICELRFDYRRINDVVVEGNDEWYRVAFYTYKNKANEEKVGICFKDTKNVEYSLSEYQLATLRIAEGDITAKYFHEFSTDANGTRFQEIARELLAKGDNGDGIRNLKFKPVASLQILNEQVGGEVCIYQDVCYSGIEIYRKGLRELMKKADPKDTTAFFKSYVYRDGIADLRAALHITPLKAGKGVPENEVRIPIFKVG
jgi:hypothetical protein